MPLSVRSAFEGLSSTHGDDISGNIILTSKSSCFTFKSLISDNNFSFCSSSIWCSWSLVTSTNCGLDANASSTSLAISFRTASTAPCRSRKVFRTSLSIFACILVEICGNKVPSVIFPCTIARWRAAFPVPAPDRCVSVCYVMNVSIWL